MVDPHMSNAESVQAIEKNIEQAKVIVEFGSTLERLRSNRDFKKIIIDGYLEQECVRLVHLKADPNMQAADKQAGIVKQMDAIGALNQYFQTVFSKAAMAEKAVASDEDERQMLLEEGL